LIKVTDSEFCTKIEETEQHTIVNEVYSQFREVMEKHKRRPAKWYNDDGRYRSAVIEMLNMKENAMAVPKLSIVMYTEWKNKQKFLRQANRMVSKDRSRYCVVRWMNRGLVCHQFQETPYMLSSKTNCHPTCCFQPLGVSSLPSSKY
jgi:hypothetical protein